jgi:tetratricopeptide (TPR) repeat protein
MEYHQAAWPGPHGWRVSVTVRYCAVLLYVSLVLGPRPAAAQDLVERAPTGTACLEMNRTVVSQIRSGRIGEAEVIVSTALKNPSGPLCEGLMLANMAAVRANGGRFSEAETLAQKSIKLLTPIYSPESRILLYPLQVIAAARFEQGKIANAREVFQRMQLLRIDRPEDAALVHGMSASLLEAEGRRPEAEYEYLAALHSWNEAGSGETADAGAILYSLASLYVREDRFDDARRTLDRAFAIVTRAKDAVPMDRVKLLHVQGGLHYRQGKWQEAEQVLHEAVSIADGVPRMLPSARAVLLAEYANVLRKNHHRREARLIEERLAVLRRTSATGTVVDVTELLPKPKPAKK